MTAQATITLTCDHPKCERDYKDQNRRLDAGQLRTQARRLHNWSSNSHFDKDFCGRHNADVDKWDRKEQAAPTTPESA